MAETPTLPKNREGSGTSFKPSEKAGPPASLLGAPVVNGGHFGGRVEPGLSGFSSGVVIGETKTSNSLGVSNVEVFDVAEDTKYCFVFECVVDLVVRKCVRLWANLGLWGQDKIERCCRSVVGRVGEPVEGLNGKRTKGNPLHSGRCVPFVREKRHYPKDFRWHGSEEFILPHIRQNPSAFNILRELYLPSDCEKHADGESSNHSRRTGVYPINRVVRVCGGLTCVGLMLLFARLAVDSILLHNDWRAWLRFFMFAVIDIVSFILLLVFISGPWSLVGQKEQQEYG